MRNAGKILGIVGGCLSILVALILIFSICIVGNIADKNGIVDRFLGRLQERLADDPNVDLMPGTLQEFGGIGIDIFMAIIWAVVVILLIGGILGLIGGLIIGSKNIASGVLMCIAALFTSVLGITFILFVIGGVFAFIYKKEEARCAA